MDCCPQGSSVQETCQSRILEWVAISFPGDIPDPGIKPGSPTLPADSLQSELLEAQVTVTCSFLIPHCTLYTKRAEKVSSVFSKQVA